MLRSLQVASLVSRQRKELCEELSSEAGHPRLAGGRGVQPALGWGACPCSHSVTSLPRAAELMTRTSSVVTLEVAKQGAIYHGLATLLNQPSPMMQRSKGGGGAVSSMGYDCLPWARQPV